MEHPHAYVNLSSPLTKRNEFVGA